MHHEEAFLIIGAAPGKAGEKQENRTVGKQNAGRRQKNSDIENQKRKSKQ
jgi:hypothetical protein